jgi:hypothetical protein
MIAHRATLGLALLLLAASAGRAGEVQADPAELYERARAEMKQGDLEAASSSASALRALLTKDPRWDPDGVYAHRLLPPLLARLERLKEITRGLDDFNARAGQGLKAPKTVADFPTVQQYTNWATSLIRRLRRERDQIVGAGALDAEDRACIARTSSYAATERLLQTDLLKKVSDAAGDEVLGLLSGDPRMEAVLLRFRQLKLDLVRVMGERDALGVQLRKAKESETELRQSLASSGEPTRIPLALEVLLLTGFGLIATIATWMAILRGRALAAARRASAAATQDIASEIESQEARHDAA